ELFFQVLVFSFWLRALPLINAEIAFFVNFRLRVFTLDFHLATLRHSKPKLFIEDHRLVCKRIARPELSGNDSLRNLNHRTPLQNIADRYTLHRNVFFAEIAVEG